MSNITLDKAKQFESLIIKCLLSKYGSNLPKNKIELLNSSSFITQKKINNVSSIEEIQGLVIREVFKNVIDITCQKELSIDGKKISIPYGYELNNALIEYYSESLSKDYNIKINKIENLNDDLKMVRTLKEKLDSGLDKMIFESDAIKILEASELKELITKNDNLAIERYVKEKENIINAKDELKQEELDTINKELSDKSRLQIVYLNGKQHIKYVDKNDTVHLIESKDPLILSKAYKDIMLKFNSQDKLNVDDFFEELKDINDEIKLSTLNDKDLNKISSQEIDMLDFVHSNAKNPKEKITHSEDNTIHVIESTNEIITTEKYNDEDKIKSEIIKDDPSGLKEDGNEILKQEVIDNDEEIISDEEAQKLNNRFLSGEKLSLEELRKLRTYEKNKSLNEEEIAQIQIDNLKEIRSSGSSINLVPKYHGYARGFIMIYILIVCGTIGLSLGTLLFKFFN